MNDIEKEVEEFVKNTKKNFNPLKYKVCNRDMTLDEMLEHMMPQFQQALKRSHQAGIEQGRKDREGEVLEWADEEKTSSADLFGEAVLTDCLKEFIQKK